MTSYPFHLINMFAERRLGGNPVVVFTTAEMPDEQTRQTLAYQMAVAETAFISDDDTLVHVHSPQYALPFSCQALLSTAEATHPNEIGLAAQVFKTHLGEAWLLRQADRWWSQMSTPHTRQSIHSVLEIAEALALNPKDIVGRPLFVDCGLEQLIVQVKSQQSVLQANPQPQGLAKLAESSKNLPQAAVWCRDDNQITLRFFSCDAFTVYEDFGSGTGAANIAGWLLASGQSAPFSLRIEQGHTIHRLVSRLSVILVEVDENRVIRVGGNAHRVGGGVIEL
ncbi:PhzF family phenazine biosynthesis protein [Iodobacter sp.]|uniref:PhzF family phenazine biosynthesis protein n=1 Tax=Iodobacter sp. TaxID=1915058 RepID=UPI0025DD1CB2|nr:PhzF family phenazine biosynthesis protein [Iodobacter sp.]